MSKPSWQSLSVRFNATGVPLQQLNASNVVNHIPCSYYPDGVWLWVLKMAAYRECLNPVVLWYCEKAISNYNFLQWLVIKYLLRSLFIIKENLVVHDLNESNNSRSLNHTPLVYRCYPMFTSNKTWCNNRVILPYTPTIILKSEITSHIAS